MAIRFRQVLIGVTALLSFSVQSAFAENLTQVYRDALQNDPTFKQAEANWLTIKQNLPIAESSLFPTFNLTANLDKNYTKTPNIGTDGFYSTNNFGMTITEQVFDFANWMQISGAKYQVRASTATYMAAIQSLMNRTAAAYFETLKAAASLRFIIANKNSTWQLYVQSEQKYKVGLIAITPVYDAQAKYDIAVSQEIEARNEVHDRLEDLRAITSKFYTHLSSLGSKQVPLFIPVPKNIDKWTSIATKQNWGIVSDKYTLLFQKRQIQRTAAGNYPTLDANAAWTSTNYNAQGVDLGLSSNKAGTVAGLSLNFPFFQGGLISAETQQEEYKYMRASATLLLTYRTVVNDTRQAYLGIIAGISGVKADRQSVISNRNSFRATQAGYAVGTRTMVDLLQALTQLYNTERTYVLAQYDYIINLVSLKQNAGTLSTKDLAKINSWLIQREKLVSKKFTNTYTPDNPPPNLKLQGQSDDLAPAPTAPQARPYGDGPRTGDMPRLNNTDTSSRDVKRDHYGVQLYASNSRHSAQSFVVTNGLVGKAKIMRSHAKKKPAYKVMMGNYKTFAKANKARRSLPKSLQKMHPWVSHIRAKQHRIVATAAKTKSPRTTYTVKPVAKKQNIASTTKKAKVLAKAAALPAPKASVKAKPKTSTHHVKTAATHQKQANKNKSATSVKPKPAVKTKPIQTAMRMDSGSTPGMTRLKPKMTTLKPKVTAAKPEIKAAKAKVTAAKPNRTNAAPAADLQLPRPS
ncbi:MAG: TolC family outer membrane protein [Coxiellaceae bacterium]|nr:TolC family outer membrane protein [Coxiellaceae bacterium]